MREAVGGTLLLKIVIVFLVVYIGFMAIVLNYGLVFRYKNQLINYIEQNEGIKNVETLRTTAKEKYGYYGDIDACNVKVNDRGYYYKVKIYIIFHIPLVNNVLRIPVTGETRIIETGNVEPDIGWEC